MNRTLKASAVTATLWSILRVGWSSAASFLVFAFLIRHLSLADIGLFALASAFVEIVRVVAGGGLADGLQREAELDDLTLDSAFWGGVALSIVMAAAMALSAPVYAHLMREPHLRLLIYALAGLMMVSTLSQVHWALTLRDFGHKTFAMRTMLATVLGGGGAVIAALLGAGVWALMVQALASELVGVVFAWGTCRWRPQMRFSWRRLRPLLTFGWGLVLTRLLWSVLGRIPDFFIGRTIGTEAVGIYRVAWRLVDLLGQMFLAPLSNVTFLTLARLQDDKARFEAVYARVVGLGALTMAPLVVGFGVTAQEVVPLVFGPRSTGSIPIAQILAISAPAFVINYFTTSALLAKGKSYVVSQAAAVQLISTLAISALVAPYGVIALTIAYVVRGYLTLPYIQYLVHRHAQVGLVAVFRFVRAPVIAVTAMAAALIAIRPFVEAVSTLAVLRLAIFVPIGATIYVAMLVVIDRGLLQSHFLFARSLFGRPPSGPKVGDDDLERPSSGT